MRAFIIIDLGFGDAGKGLLTDFLARQTGASLVVRYNGGAQAGHNVVTPDGRHHTFAQFGSASFIPGVHTFLTGDVVIHPTALLAEGNLLRLNGLPDIFDRLRISDRSLVITPFHQAANRIRELCRGPHRHGSCGVGVGEAVEEAQAHPHDAIRAGDLSQTGLMRRKLRSLQERKRIELKALVGNGALDLPLAREFSLFERTDVIDRWLTASAPLFALNLVCSDELLSDRLRESQTVIFEGAQGVLLDQDAGFHPYTTWSRTTGRNALEVLHELAPETQAVQIGVVRLHMVRHGPGPLPTEAAFPPSLIQDHNQTGEWQGAVRYGWFDAPLVRYALKVNRGVDALALTHVDTLARLDRWMVCPQYDDGGEVETLLSESPPLSMDRRCDLTRKLMAVRPRLKSVLPDERQVLQQVETQLGQVVNLLSRGPAAGNVEIVQAF